LKVFFDTEFTHFDDGRVEPAQLISIGCVSQDSKQFYTENADYNESICSEFVCETIIPLLEGGLVLMSSQKLAQKLLVWVESFNEEVVFVTDAADFDWPFVVQLFDQWGWPSNLNRDPEFLGFLYRIQVSAFESAILHAFTHMALRRHHALDDALANQFAYQRVMSISSGT
jgi:DNA polymerase elongation subunit (family B)